MDAELKIVTVSRYGIKVATAQEDVMVVPWKVMKSLASDHKEPYATLYAEAREVMLKRLERKRTTPAAHPRATIEGTLAAVRVLIKELIEQQPSV